MPGSRTTSIVATALGLTAIALLLSAAPASSQTSSYAATVLADTPAAYWRLEETSGTQAGDSSGNGKHGTYQGGATLGQTGVISAGLAPSLDGTDDGVHIPTVVTISGANPLTLEAWVKTTDANGPILTHRWSAAEWPILSLHLGYQGCGNSGGRPTLIVRDAADRTYCRHVMVAPVAVNDGLAHHIVATRDTSRQWRLYIDGVERASMTDTVSSIDPIDLVAIGIERYWALVGFQLPAYRYLGGKVDEVALYTTALSPARIQAHYQAGIQAPPPPPSGPPPEQTFGAGENGTGRHGHCGCRVFADPVNSRTGAFTTSVDDLDLPGTGVSFSWGRSYTSADATAGRLGPGWTDSYSASLAIQPNGDARLHGEDGQQLLYTKQPDGSFVGAPGSLSTIRSVTGGYELLRTDQVAYRFDAQGRLLSIKDRNDQGLTLGYDGQGRLATVTDAAGRQATVSYNAQGLVSQVQTQDGRSVVYDYLSGRVKTVTDVRGKLWTYEYDAAGRLEKIIDPLNHAQVTNVYGTDGRVSSQRDALGKETTFGWNAATETATATDANQNAWTHDYAQGVLVEEVDPLGNDTDLVLDDDLNTTAVTGPTDETTQMTYDAAGNLLTATAPPSLESAEKTFAYTARNDIDLVTDARGKVTDYVYFPTGANLLRDVVQDGVRVASYTYDPAGRVETFTDGNEKTWTYTYFAATGYLASSTDPLGNKTTYTYDGAGRVATRVDPKGNCSGCTPADFTRTYTYNPAGQLLTEQDPLGHTTTNVYDDAGRLTSTSDALNRTTSYTYDDANRVLTETAPDPDGAGPLAAPVTTYTYDNVGNKLTERDPRGNTTTFAYDGANRLVSTTAPDPDGAGPQPAPVTTHTYDPNGNLASTVEPRGNVSGATPDDFRTTFTYDAAGRTLTETRPDPDGAGPALPPETTNVYDPVGNLQSVKDGNDHVTAYTYDAAGRILTVTGPDLGVTTYSYDDAGNVLTRRDDNQHTTTFAYDAAGQLVSETSPDPDGPGPQGPAVTTYTYDANGNRKTLTDPNGNLTPSPGDGLTTYGYDPVNRLTSIDYSDATPDVTFGYDPVGNRLTMVDGSGTETREYDNLDRLKSVTRDPATISYEYDPASNVTRRTYAPFGGAGGWVDYAYDPLSRLQTVGSGSFATTYDYDPASNLTQTILPAANGHVETRVYDRAGRLTEVKNQRGTSVLSHFVAILDPVGNPLQIARTPKPTTTQTFTYDDSDRIKSVCFQAGTCPGANDPFIRWTYDKVGNRLSEQRPADTTAYAYDARDRLLSAGSTSFAYDQNGNQTQKGTRTFSYDLANRLRTTSEGQTTTTYSYDGEGKRLRASTASNSNANFLWDVSFGLPQLVRQDGPNALSSRSYRYGERLISATSGYPIAGTFYYHHDLLGSIVNVTAANGAKCWTYLYEPFGAMRGESSASCAQSNSMKFAGEYLDPTGLYHLRARQYDPHVGRLLQPDPINQPADEACVSRFAYAANQPTLLADPSGLITQPINRGNGAAAYATSPLDIADLEIVKRTCPSSYYKADTGSHGLNIYTVEWQVLSSEPDAIQYRFQFQFKKIFRPQAKETKAWATGTDRAGVFRQLGYNSSYDRRFRRPSQIKPWYAKFTFWVKRETILRIRARTQFNVSIPVPAGQWVGDSYNAACKVPKPRK